MAQDILIIDDEADIRDLVSGILEDDGHQVRTARDSDEALEALRRRSPALVELDVWLQGSRIDGLELLTMLKEIDADLPVIVISGHGTIETRSDEADIRDLGSGILEDDGHQVRTARDSDEALEALRRRSPALVVLDVWLQGSRIDGLELLTMLKEIDADLPVIVISGHGTIET